MSNNIYIQNEAKDDFKNWTKEGYNYCHLNRNAYEKSFSSKSTYQPITFLCFFAD